MKTKLFVLVIAIVGFGVAIVSLFGTTVSSKYSHASQEVMSEVTFGGGYAGSQGSSGRYRSAPRAQSAVNGVYGARPAAPAAPAATATAPAVDAAVDALSTFALDVDTASYTHTRATLEHGGWPSPSTVRPEEFVNYFDYDRKPTVAGTPFAVTMESSPSPVSSDRRKHVLRVQLDTREVSDEDRKPAHLTFLIDVSGSMVAPTKLPLAKDSLRYLVSQLDERDTVAIATYAGSSRLVLAPTSAADSATINAALASLTASGGTAMSAGMDLAYDAALQAHVAGHTNRVIVVSDGDANIGATTHNEILASIRSRVDDGIEMSTVGVGMNNYRSELMEQLADNGNGNAFYVDDMREAKRIFGRELNGTLEVVAKEAKVQVEFDTARVANYRLIGYENRAIADHEFRDDSVDAGELGSGHQVTAIYEVELRDASPRPYATARLRWMEPGEFVASEGHREMRASDIKRSVGSSSADHQFAVGTALFADKLRGADYLSEISWALIEEVTRPGVTADRPARFELLEMIRTISERS